MSKSGAPLTNFTTGTKGGRWWNFPFAAQQSTIAGAECRARSRPWLPLKRFPCRAVPRSAWSECVGLKRLFLSGSGPSGDLFTIATRKGRPPQKKYLYLRQPPSSRELHTPPLQSLAASQNQEETGFCYRVALNLLGSICVASPRLSRTRQMDHGNSLVVL